MLDDDAHIRLLPPRPRALARRIGLAALLELARWRGGITVYVPGRERLQPSHPIAQVIGYEAAYKLAEEEGRRIDVPMMGQAYIALLHRQIREYRGTHSESETAIHFGVTDRHVRRLMATGDQDSGPQVDMFGKA